MVFVFLNLYVSYKREYSIINDVRISIDNEIEYQDYKTSIKFSDDNIIVELKTVFNKNLDELVSDFPFQRIRFSKYCFAIEKLYNFLILFPSTIKSNINLFNKMAR